MNTQAPKSAMDVPPITWDFYEGAYGPSILAQLPDRDAVDAMCEIFRRVAESGATVRLNNEPRMQLNDIATFDLVRTGISTSKTLWTKDGGHFVWSATRERWLRHAELLEPFLAGETGHQYLTEEGHDDALIEVSFGETHP